MSNRTTETGALGRDPSRADATARILSSPIVALVPNSGIQVIDGYIPASLVAATSRRYLEENGANEPGAAAALYPVELEDGILYHPTRHAPLDPSRARLVTGANALEPFLDRWVPLPYLRVLRRDQQGELGLDDGPTNWVRIFITADDGPDTGQTGGYRVAIAVDTALDRGPREIDRPYVAPCEDDARLASTFLCPDEPGLLAWFVSEPWVDDWLSELCRAAGLVRAAPHGATAVKPLAFEHVARYLTLIALLRSAALVPRLRFLDPTGGPTAAIPVDLVLDIGAARTAAILIERGGEDGATDVDTARFLPIRDLSRPTMVHAGPFASRVELVRASFGSEVISRRSGRADAFQWPSLVRIGFEADRLASLPAAHDGVTGLESPRTHLRDVAPSPTLWRTADPTRPDGDGATVVSPLLALLTEAGDVRSRIGARTKPALRARFSRSSTVTFFVAEILAHAVAAINGPIRHGRDMASAAPRRLDRIVVTAPLSLAGDDRRALRERIDAAVDLVSGAMRADPRGRPGPATPEVVIGHNEPLGAQAVYLYDAVTSRLRGLPGDLFATLGRARADHGVHPSLRIGGFDIGANEATLTVVTYESAPNGVILPRVALSETIADSGDRMIEAVATEHILPAIETRLADLGGDGASLQRLLGASGAIGDPAHERERRRFLNRAAIPLARALVCSHLLLGPSHDADEVTLTIGDLATHAAGLAAPAVRWLEGRVAAQGLPAFDLLPTPIGLSHKALAATISRALGPVVTAAGRIVEAYECDLMLVSGWAGQLAEVRSRLLEDLPLRPDRIVAMHACPIGAWYPFRTASGRIGDGKPMVAVGTALLARGIESAVPFDTGAVRQPGETNHLARLTDAIRTVETRRLLAFGAQGEAGVDPATVSLSDSRVAAPGPGERTDNSRRQSKPARNPRVRPQ